MGQPITDVNATLEKDHKYLLYFDLPQGLPVDITRKISDGTNMLTTWGDRYGSFTDVELLGTTVAEKAGDQGQDQFQALIKVHGTPLLAAVAPVVAIALIVAGVFLVIQFRKAIDVTLQSVATGITTVTEAAKTTAESIASGVQSIGEGLGSGLNYALPILGVGISVLAVIVFFGYVRAPRI